eukprot:15335580-Ditylum_brightwellii.AAC.1
MQLAFQLCSTKTVLLCLRGSTCQPTPDPNTRFIPPHAVLNAAALVFVMIGFDLDFVQDSRSSFRKIMRKANTLTAILWSSLLLCVVSLIRSRVGV